MKTKDHEAKVWVTLVDFLRRKTSPGLCLGFKLIENLWRKRIGGV